MAESWSERNEITKKPDAICDTKNEAYDKAFELTSFFSSMYGIEIEYGVRFNRLCKDGAEVEIIEM